MNGRYEVRAKLGTGGMGIVYRAHDRCLGREVALKTVRIAEGSGGNDDLVSEARALAAISHANVVTVFDMGNAGDEMFITMELIHGVTLRQWLAEPRAIDEVVAVFVDAGRGLAAAHAAGLVHGDFKPSNVMVGDDGSVKVVDFGLARPRQAHHETSSVLRGTPRYMAPEQHVGEPASARSDQFSFCAALFEALCGQLPFRGETLQELRRAIWFGDVDWTGSDHVPGALRAVLERGLSRFSERRFSSMAELLGALTQ